LPKIHEKGQRWEVVVTLSEGSFGQVSFVNSVATIKGGTHVAYVVDQLCNAISKKVSLKNRNGVEVKNMHIKNHLMVFINCLIENPAFDSQIKETLTTKPAKFGSTFTISDKALKQVCNSGIVDNVLLWAEGNKTLDLQRKMKTGGTKGQRQLTGIPKLEDAKGKKDKGKSFFDDDLFSADDDDEDDKKAPHSAAAKPKKAADKKPAAAAAAAAAAAGKKNKRKDDDDDESSDTPKKTQPENSKAKAKNPHPKKPPKQRSEDDEDEDDRMEDVEDEESEEVRRPRRAAAQATGGGKKKYVKSDDDEDDEEEEDDNGDDDFEG